MPDASWEELLFECNAKHVHLTSVQLQNEFEMSSYDVHGVSCCELEVDLLTGNFIIRRADILEDVGESYSPFMDIGQVEGAFIMGLGCWLSERIIYGPAGDILTNRTWNYCPPGPKDIPVDFRVTFLKDSGNDKNIFNSKVVGEPPICLSAVVVFALRNALMSARKDAGLVNQWFDFKSPYTVDHIFATAGTEFDKYEL